MISLSLSLSLFPVLGLLQIAHDFKKYNGKGCCPPENRTGTFVVEFCGANHQATEMYHSTGVKM